MFILGLTGSIGMGKTWASQCMRLMGARVHDADACVHRLMGPRGLATPHVVQAFGRVLKENGAVDRQKLARMVLHDDRALITLEAILHPLVRHTQRQFLQHCQRARVSLAVLDIPLLYETHHHFHRPLDAVMVVSAPRFIQYQRVMQRSAMNAQKFCAIEQRQIADVLKRQWADFVIYTGTTRGQTWRQIKAALTVCRESKAQAWSPHWGL